MLKIYFVNVSIQGHLKSDKLPFKNKSLILENSIGS